ncbi:hypothetical protein ACV3Z6_15590, partial [Clostridium perfringens]
NCNYLKRQALLFFSFFSLSSYNTLGEINPESYLIKNAKDNTYLLALPNNLNGYNYFEVYIDKLNKSIHVFDSLDNRKGGTSAINSADEILKIRNF